MQAGKPSYSPNLSTSISSFFTQAKGTESKDNRISSIFSTIAQYATIGRSAAKKKPEPSLAIPIEPTSRINQVVKSTDWVTAVSPASVIFPSSVIQVPSLTHSELNKLKNYAGYHGTISTKAAKDRLKQLPVGSMFVCKSLQKLHLCENIQNPITGEKTFSEKQITFKEAEKYLTNAENKKNIIPSLSSEDAKSYLKATLDARPGRPCALIRYDKDKEDLALTRGTMFYDDNEEKEMLEYEEDLLFAGRTFDEIEKELPKGTIFVNAPSASQT